MKKLLSYCVCFVFAAVLLFTSQNFAIAETIMSNSSISANDDIVGKWINTHMGYGGVIIDISNANIDTSWQFNADGSVTITIAGVKSEGTWSRNANEITITEGGESYSANIVDGKIILEVSGKSIIFTREGYTSSYKLPSPIMAESEDEFFGTWNLSRTLSEGVLLSPYEMAAMGLNMNMTFTISRGEACIDIIMEGMQDYNNFETSFSDGRLQLMSTINSVAAVAVLTDSGEFYITLPFGYFPLQVYFTKKTTGESGSKVSTEENGSAKSILT